jgi:hypothetical protein
MASGSHGSSEKRGSATVSRRGAKIHEGYPHDLAIDGDSQGRPGMLPLTRSARTSGLASSTGGVYGPASACIAVDGTATGSVCTGLMTRMRYRAPRHDENYGCNNECARFQLPAI